MSAALLSVASALVFVGFIFWGDTSLSHGDHLLATSVIIIGVLMTIGSLFVIRHEKKDEREQRITDREAYLSELRGLREDMRGDKNEHRDNDNRKSNL